MLSKKRKMSNTNDSPSENIQQKLKRFARDKKNDKSDNNEVLNNEIINNGNSKNDEIILSESSSIAEKMLLIEQNLCTKLLEINFQSGVDYIYNPIDYAFNVHAMYVRRYCNNVKKILFLGMNPGPWGMSQTGVPFGEISMVRDWLKISGNVGKPHREQPDRKVTGFDCPRSEVSGQRLWGLFREICKDPKNFFKYAYLHNYCPIALMDHKGRNITPADLKGEGQKLLHQVCDQALTDIVKLLEIKTIVGIGKYAEKRAQTVVSAASLPIEVVSITHPSPRVVGNENWQKKTESRLHDLGLMQYLNGELVPQNEKFTLYLCEVFDGTFDITMDILAWMDVALKTAEASLILGEVPVGCLFIYNNEIIATGSNTVNETCNATRHAEMKCIDQVLAFCKEKGLAYKEIFRNIDIIVTVEPCIMCTSALYQLEVHSIVYGCANDRFGGCISVLEVPTLYKSKTTIIGNVKDQEAVNLLKHFYKGTNPNAPVPKIKKLKGN